MFLHHLALHLHSDSCRSTGSFQYNRLLSSSTGADGIKGKGCSLTCALFRFLFTFSSNSVKQQMEQCHGSGEAAKSRALQQPGVSAFILKSNLLSFFNHYLIIKIKSCAVRCFFLQMLEMLSNSKLLNAKVFSFSQHNRNLKCVYEKMDKINFLE